MSIQYLHNLAKHKAVQPDLKCEVPVHDSLGSKQVENGGSSKEKCEFQVFAKQAVNCFGNPIIQCDNAKKNAGS